MFVRRRSAALRGWKVALEPETSEERRTAKGNGIEEIDVGRL